MLASSVNSLMGSGSAVIGRPKHGLRLLLGGLGLLRGDLLALRLNHLCDGLLVLGLAAAANFFLHCSSRSFTA